MTNKAQYEKEKANDVLYENVCQSKNKQTRRLFAFLFYFLCELLLHIQNLLASLLLIIHLILEVTLARCQLPLAELL